MDGKRLLTDWLSGKVTCFNILRFFFSVQMVNADIGFFLSNANEWPITLIDIFDIFWHNKTEIYKNFILFKKF